MKFKKILVTGGNGMVGRALKEQLPEAVYLLSKDCDLTSYEQTIRTFKFYKPDCVIHLAARVGGVLANQNFIGDFYRDNILMNTNVLEASRVLEVNKLVSMLSTCIYPDECSYPLTPDQLHAGPPHFSNYGYAHAKRMLEVQTRAYRDQYSCNFISAIPNNLFGRFDNFHYHDSHVIPAMIRKIYDAREKSHDVVLWGTGSPLREFTYADDLAKIIIFLLENYDEEIPINVGNTSEVSIKQLAETIAEIMNFQGKIVWDHVRPNGQLRKPTDNSQLLRIGWKKEDYSDFYSSLQTTCNWFEKNYPNVRGVK